MAEINNQKKMILDYIKANGSISSYDAFAELGIARLASRISELRKEGYDIISEQKTGLNRFGRHVKYFRYRFGNKYE